MAASRLPARRVYPGRTDCRSWYRTVHEPIDAISGFNVLPISDQNFCFPYSKTRLVRYCAQPIVHVRKYAPPACKESGLWQFNVGDARTTIPFARMLIRPQQHAVESARKHPFLYVHADFLPPTQLYPPTWGAFMFFHSFQRKHTWLSIVCNGRLSACPARVPHDLYSGYGSWFMRAV